MVHIVIQIEVNVVGSALLTPCLESILKDLFVRCCVPSEHVVEDILISITVSVYDCSQRWISCTAIELVNSFHQILSCKYTFFPYRLCKV